MKVPVALAIGALVAAPAYAQEAGVAPPSQERWQVVWKRRPTGDDVARVYPREAVRNNIPGVGVLCCVPRPDGSVSCNQVAEWPAGMGFGSAALALSSHYRATRESAATFDPANMRPFPLVTRFQMQPMNEAYRAGFERAQEVVQRPNICAASAPVS